MKNLLNKDEQYEASALRNLNKEHDKEVPCLEDGIKRLRTLNKKIMEKGCDRVEEENATFKQRMKQLVAEHASLKNNLENEIAEAKKGGVKDDDSKLRENLKKKTRS
nr:unnamed protein product [Callosobruchus chinensis]